MTITAGNLLVVFAVISGIFAAVKIAHKLMQWVELVTKTSLLTIRLLNNGEDVPSWLADQYKKINGNNHSTLQEKHDLLGESHDSGELTRGPDNNYYKSKGAGQ